MPPTFASEQPPAPPTTGTPISSAPRRTRSDLRLGLVLGLEPALVVAARGLTLVLELGTLVLRKMRARPRRRPGARVAVGVLPRLARLGPPVALTLRALHGLSAVGLRRG